MKQENNTFSADITTHDVTGIILAGGRNSRMGKNKAFLTVKNDRKIIDHITELFKQLFQDTIIVTNEPELYQYLGTNITQDIIPQKGPLSGIHAGLIKANTDYSFIVSCDMPFLVTDVIKLLVNEAPGFDVVVPQIKNYLEPLHAVYHKNCIKQIEKSLAMDIFKVYAFYPWVKVNFVGETKLNQVKGQQENDLDKIFFNVNTQAELNEAKKL